MDKSSDLVPGVHAVESLDDVLRGCPIHRPSGDSAIGQVDDFGGSRNEQGEVAQDVVRELVARLDDRSCIVRGQVAKALGMIGDMDVTAAGEAVPGLTKLLKDESAEVRYEAEAALKRITEGRG